MALVPCTTCCVSIYLTYAALIDGIFVDLSDNPDRSDFLRAQHPPRASVRQEDRKALQ